MKIRTVFVAFLCVVLLACNNVASTEQVASSENNGTESGAGDGHAAYLVFNYRIDHAEAYRPYLAAVPKTLETYDAKVVVADFASETVEGDAGEVTVVLKFKSKAAAKLWYQSPEYQSIVNLRRDSSTGIAALASSADE